MQIIPHRLYQLRTARSLTRKVLAGRAGVSVRQIQRLENPVDASRSVRPTTVTKLAQALGVNAKDLTGAPVTSDQSRTVHIGRSLRPGVSLAYELVGRRYGVTVGEILNMAPLLFALVAEQSLSWRAAEYDRISDAADRLLALASGRMRVAYHAGNVHNEMGYEWEAIQKPDLFNDPFPADYDFYDGDWDGNPFADYLRMLVEKLEPFWREIADGDSDARPGRIRFEIYDHTGAMASKVPEYSVCGDDLKAYAQAGSDALYALHAGDVRLSEIPHELLGEDAEAQRRAWLEEKLSQSSKDWLARIFSLDDLSPDQDSPEDGPDGGRK